MRHRGVVTFYQSGLRYEDDNRLKPGLIAHSLAIQHYLDGKASEYDFLAGERGRVQYKQSLGSCKRQLMWIELNAATSKMRLVKRLIGIRNTLLARPSDHAHSPDAFRN